MYLNFSNRAHGAAEVTPEVYQCNVTEMLQIMQSIMVTTSSKMLFSGSLTLNLNSSLAVYIPLSSQMKKHKDVQQTAGLTELNKGW